MMYGGGDTLQEFKNLCPGLYLSVAVHMEINDNDNVGYYIDILSTITAIAD